MSATHYKVSRFGVLYYMGPEGRNVRGVLVGRIYPKCLGFHTVE